MVCLFVFFWLDLVMWFYLFVNEMGNGLFFFDNLVFKVEIYF